ncbi:hypothetical protein QUW28_03180 [Enorma phocaeensis]|uniref:Radical SAM protein n=2 Tax=Enorma phocaeensis TaxID=1871019 RepID=A0ABT7V7P7_9ACTN|nr:radical SAM protein [Enorma phocaeensis]MDM8274509.1 hypothetical protein [Enorma phocaeensis]
MKQMAHVGEASGRGGRGEAPGRERAATASRAADAREALNRDVDPRSYPKYAEWRRLCEENPGMAPFVIMKLSLTCHGAIISPRAMERLQQDDYRFGTVPGEGDEANSFEIEFAGRSTSQVMPGAVVLRDGTFVFVNYGEAYEDPYLLDLDVELGAFVLREAREGDPAIDVVDFVPRPGIFGRRTSRGTLMDTLVDVRPQKLIFTAYRTCHFWDRREQCRFCAFFTKGHEDPAVDPEDLYETVHAALEEPGRFSELYLSGGTDYSGAEPFEREVERYICDLQAMGRDFSGRFPCQLMAPAYPRHLLERIRRETGITSYSADIEVWDRERFRWLCPGKERVVGHDEWVRRTVDAVEVFGRGNVYTQVVAGAELAAPHGFETTGEALASNLAGCEYFAERGVNCLFIVWRPHRRARLGWQPMAPVDYYVRLAQGFHDIRRAHGLICLDDDYKMCGNHPCADLERMDEECWR